MFYASIAFCFTGRKKDMAAKKSKKRIKAEGAKVRKEEAGERAKWGSPEDSMLEGKMDFGGLPDRDIKKNLGGCG